VSTNGNLQFTTADDDYGQFTRCMPGLTQFGYALLPHWGDLRIIGVEEGVFTSVSGSAPNRIFNIEWRASTISGNPGSLNFEIRLYEGLSRIDFVYGSVPGNGQEMTVGVQRAGGTAFTQYSCLGASLAKGQVLTFVGTADTSLAISGLLRDANFNPLIGATVNLSGTATTSATTDANGQYTFAGLSNGGNYTVTPTPQAGFSFFPASYTFNPLNGIQGANFFRVRPPAAGELLISEFRLRGSGAFASSNEFVELYNNTNSIIIVNAADGSTGWSIVNSTAAGPAQELISIPNGTLIPARGHFLVAAGGYGLSNYSSADLFYPVGVVAPDDSGTAVFSTSNSANWTTSTRLDAVGFIDLQGVSSPALFREGTGLPSIGANSGEYSFVRRLNSGLPRDTGDNASDFAFVSTSGGVFGGRQSTLGAPGPENLSSPLQHNVDIKSSFVDQGCAGFGAPTSACARVRDTTVVTNGTLGTLTLRRRFTNATGLNVTRLRFRIVDITTLGNTVAGQADLRALTSALGSFVNVTNSSGQTVRINNLTLEEAPNSGGTNTLPQTAGGGLNSSLAAGVITLATPLGPGQNINVQFRLGVQATGGFRFFV
ncbi:MAG: lamin tail domain-containing protein, partial [Pyrinomonadaceae bacterium]